MHRPKPLRSIKTIVQQHRGPIQSAVHETTSGGIVWRYANKDSKAVEILLIKDTKNRWTIPKGHVEPNEPTDKTAEREIREETGLQDMKVLNWLGKVNFRYKRESTLVLMTMHIYLVKALGDTNKLNGEQWLKDLQWLPANQAIEHLAYDDINKLMLLGLKQIREGNL